MQSVMVADSAQPQTPPLRSILPYTVALFAQQDIVPFLRPPQMAAEYCCPYIKPLMTVIFSSVPFTEPNNPKAEAAGSFMYKLLITKLSPS